MSIILFDSLRHKLDGWKRASNDLNNLTFNDLYLRMVDLSVNMYEWYNLPETVDERFLEMTLFTYGSILFFKDRQLDYVVMKTAHAGNLDIYNTPNERNAYAVTGYNRRLNDKDSVLIFNNRMRMPSAMTIELYAQRIADIQRAIDVNVNAQKTPLLLRCLESQRVTIKNLYKQYDGNEPVIYGTRELDEESIKAIQTQAPYVADKLNTLKHMLWNEAMTFIGIESANTDKAERLITDEVTSNLGTAEAQRYVKLNARRDAARKINKMFGLKLDVDFRSNNTILDTTSDIIRENKEDAMAGGGTDVDSATYRSYRDQNGGTKAVGTGGRQQ